MKNKVVPLVCKPRVFILILLVVGLIGFMGITVLPLLCTVFFGWSVIRIGRQRQ